MHVKHLEQGQALCAWQMSGSWYTMDENDTCSGNLDQSFSSLPLTSAVHKPIRLLFCTSLPWFLRKTKLQKAFLAGNRQVTIHHAASWQKLSFYAVEARPLLGRFTKLHKVPTWSTNRPSAQRTTFNYFEWNSKAPFCFFSGLSSITIFQWKGVYETQKAFEESCRELAHRPRDSKHSYIWERMATENEISELTRTQSIFPKESLPPPPYIMDFSFLRLLLRAMEDEDGQRASEAAKQLAGRLNRGCGKRPGE